MKIVRFLDAEGRIRLGRERGDGEAEILEGALFDDIRPTGRLTQVGKLLVPVAPVDIYGIGLNYREHCRLMGKAVPEEPPVFMKPSSSLAAPGSPIRIPAVSRGESTVDYECELAVVIGRPTRDVGPCKALDCVFGYTLANDVTDRNWAQFSQTRGKGFDGFCPLGPRLVTADEIPDPQNLGLRTFVNGEMRQHGNTSDMIFAVAEIISYLSRDTTLMPGTVILTGTPPGAAVTREPPIYLKPGDRVRVEIDGIGALTNPVSAASGSDVKAA